MTNLALPLAVLYAGLAGTVLALIVATIQNKWSLRVFFLLALRLAIGWHFLFEGLGKIHSHNIGVTETNKPFTSEPYFKEADGPLGPFMRRQIGDPEELLKRKTEPTSVPAPLAEIKDPNLRRVRGSDGIADDEFVKAVPETVRKEWDDFTKAFGEKYKLADADKRRFDGTLDDAEKAELAAAKSLAALPNKKEFEAERAEQIARTGPGDLTLTAMAAYGKWLAGAEPRDSQVKFVSGDTPLTAPQRLDYIRIRKAELGELQKRQAADLGNGYGYDMARIKDAKAVISAARTVLIADADAFLQELKADAFATLRDFRLNRQAPKPGETLDKDEAKLVAILPPPTAPNPAGFDSLPPPLRAEWDRQYAAFTGFFPDAEGVSTAYGTSKERLANWYHDKDEFTGVPKPGFQKLAKDYLTKQKRAESVKTAAAKAESEFGKSLMLAATLKAEDEKQTARAAVLNGLDGKVNDLRTFLTIALPASVAKGSIDPPTAQKATVETLDRRTMWLITTVGALLLMGLFTPVACLLGSAFLLATYLTHPPFPWLPLPPGTEGTPVFVNKNLIEMLALMVIAVHPTGRWMGLDAIWHRLVFRKAGDPT